MAPLKAEEPFASVHLSADAALLAALGPVRKGWDTEATLRVVQMLALLAAGLWAYYLYVTFQRTSNTLALQTARSQLEQAKRNLEATDLANKKTSVEVERLTQTPVTTTEELSIKPLVDAHGWYLASYVYTFTNTGNASITIDPVMAEAFVARTQLPGGATPILVNDVGDLGTLTWKCVSRRGFRIASAWEPNNRVTNSEDKAPAEKGGGGTGVMNAGEHLDGIITVLVPGKPTDFIIGITSVGQW